MKIKLQLLSYWATGSGKGGSSLDSLVLKDKNNLPYIPGKTFKGLLRDAFRETRCDNEKKDLEIQLFGQIKRKKEGDKYIETIEEDLNQGILRFNSLRINKGLAEKIKTFYPYLYTTKTRTSLDDKKQAEEHSIRADEVTIPLELEAYIGTVDGDELTKNHFENLEKSCKMLRKLGEKRHRGMGRCKVSLTNDDDKILKKEHSETKETDNTITIRCTLSDPLILVQKDKTAQNIESLDYLPGSIVRGIVANQLFKDKSELVDDVIFNGNVHFGDGNLVINGKRAYKAPFSFYKKQKEKDKFYNFQEINSWEEKTKQNRSGYVVLDKERKLQYKKVEYGSTIKSARSDAHRSSEKGGLFVYHYLKEDQIFEFEIFSKSTDNLEKVKAILAGKIFYLGKSKSAEFGGSVQFEVTGSFTKGNASKEGKFIYADSNLCFVNEYGDFTATDIAKKLTGNESAIIDWGKSQIRTRTYAPFNWHRKNWDSERLIIEKGSVIVLEKPVKISSFSVDCFKNEGFGKIMVADDSSIIPINEKCVEFDDLNKLEKIVVPEEKVKIKESDNEEVNIFVKYLKEKHNDFVQKNMNEKKSEELYIKSENQKFKKVKSSQWARVYNAIQQKHKLEDLRKELFGVENGCKKKSICYGGAKPWEKEVANSFKKVFNENNIGTIKRLVKKLMNTKSEQQYGN